MSIYKSYKHHFQLKNCNKIRLEKQKKSQRDKIINEINKCLAEMDQNQLEIILNVIQSQSLNLTTSKNNQRFLNSLLNNYNKIIVKLLI
ncbi:hypothetical protein RIR_jg9925.t1 [Rhizophagus irregularis DAOM 181602=DAOM 197198]|nr:hypothetical protein RIR_jg9925.t1 [Rhizophagus irregularis DAOM 181602=DAOM 197198]